MTDISPKQRFGFGTSGEDPQPTSSSNESVRFELI